MKTQPKIEYKIINGCLEIKDITGQYNKITNRTGWDYDSLDYNYLDQTDTPTHPLDICSNELKIKTPSGITYTLIDKLLPNGIAIVCASDLINENIAMPFDNVIDDECSVCPPEQIPIDNCNTCEPQEEIIDGCDNDIPLPIPFGCYEITWNISDCNIIATAEKEYEINYNLSEQVSVDYYLNAGLSPHEIILSSGDMPTAVISSNISSPDTTLIHPNSTINDYWRGISQLRVGEQIISVKYLGEKICQQDIPPNDLFICGGRLLFSSTIITRKSQENRIFTTYMQFYDDTPPPRVVNTEIELCFRQDPSLVATDTYSPFINSAYAVNWKTSVSITALNISEFISETEQTIYDRLTKICGVCCEESKDINTFFSVLAQINSIKDWAISNKCGCNCINKLISQIKNTINSLNGECK